MKKLFFLLLLLLTAHISPAQQVPAAGNIADKKLYLIPGAGYRYQPPAGGFFFKAILAPIIYLDPASDNFWRMYGKVYPGINLGAGYSF